MNKITAIIQARMGSTRLPGKVMLKVLDKELIYYQVERLKLCKSVAKIIIATSTSRKDDLIEKFCLKHKISYFRGSENNVLDRYYQCALKFKFKTIIRITADCPLIDPYLLNYAIKYYLKHQQYDLLSTDPSYPEGYDFDIIPFKTLSIAWKEAFLPSEREHVTPYIWNSPKFKTNRFSLEKDYSFLRLAVDEKIDYEVIKEILEEIYPKKGVSFTLEDILNLRKDKPLLFKKNIHIIRNEGYLKSVKQNLTIMQKMRESRLVKSKSYWQKAIKIIPSGTQTLSKGPTQYIQGVAPIYLDRGKGSHVWDVDGNEYIDYSMALGPITLGYGYKAVDNAIKNQLKKGATFSLMHPLEVEVAEILSQIIPCAQMVRFAKNGSDATSGAVRLARAYTGRDKIACCGYHGWQDWYIGTTARNLGVPLATRKLTLPFQYNNIDSLKKLFKENPKQIAAVIMEGIALEEPQNDFLRKVKKVAHQNGALLIFDEIVNGFRIAIAGAQEYYNVIPDLAAIGKGMANGMPISAIVGKKKYMKLFDKLFFSFTFGGEALSLAATLATIKVFQTKKVIRHFHRQGKKLLDGYNKLVTQYNLQSVTKAKGLPEHSAIFFTKSGNFDSLIIKSLFQQEIIKRGILSTGIHVICLSHTDKDIDKTLDAYDKSLRILKKALENNSVKKLLEGKPISPIFKRW